MRSHVGAWRDRRRGTATRMARELLLPVPAPAVERRHIPSLAVALVVFTLFFLSLTLFGPARPNGADRAAASFTEPVVCITTVVVPGGDAPSGDTARDADVNDGASGSTRPTTGRDKALPIQVD